MKIAVCGKGGCGKSTITSLLAKEDAKISSVGMPDGCNQSAIYKNTTGLGKTQSIALLIVSHFWFVRFQSCLVLSAATLF